MVQVADPPFDSSDADIILRSGDLEPVDFRVHKIILSIASSVFKDIFSIPQAPSITNPGTDGTELPLVQVSEKASILDPLLRLVYPVPPPNIESLDALEGLIAAIDKYDLSGVKHHISNALRNPMFLEAFPLRIFAIAAQHGFKDEAKIASKYTITHGRDIFSINLRSEVKNISAETEVFHQLASVHHQRSLTLISAIHLGTPQCMLCNTWDRLKEISRGEIAPSQTSKRAKYSWAYLRGTGRVDAVGPCGSANCDFVDALTRVKRKLDESITASI